MQATLGPFGFEQAVKTRHSSSSMYVAVAAHVIVLLALFAIARHVVNQPHNPLFVQVKDVPPITLPAGLVANGGSNNGPSSVSLGHPPRVEEHPILTPTNPPTIPPIHAVDPAVQAQPVQMVNNNLLNIGSPTGAHVGVSLGDHGGPGAGNGGPGPGYGPGNGGPGGEGVLHAGMAGVRAPILLNSVDPEFSEEARKAKFSGNVQVYLWVDEHGLPSHVRVVRGVGMGLDEKAVEAVRQYRFKPAMKDGKPVKVDMYVNVDFQIY